MASWSRRVLVLRNMETCHCLQDIPQMDRIKRYLTLVDAVLKHPICIFDFWLAFPFRDIWPQSCKFAFVVYAPPVVFPHHVSVNEASRSLLRSFLYFWFLVDVPCYVLFQTEDAARWWRDTKVAPQQLAVLGAGPGKEYHCRGGPEGGRSTAGSAVLQCSRLYCRSDARTREVHFLQQWHSEHDSSRAEHLPATECIEGLSTVKMHVSCFRHSQDPIHCIWFSVNEIAELPSITT